MNDVVALPESRRSLIDHYLETQAARRRGRTAIGRRDRHEPAPLSYAQEQVWLHAQMAPALPLYNEPVTIHYTGSLDVAALERSLEEIVRRHEAWRTEIRMGDSGPVPIVLPGMPVRLPPVVDLRRMDPREREAAAVRLATEDARVPLRMDEAPLFRMRLVRLDEDRYRLYLVLSHIIFDGVAIYRVFLPELAALYEAFAAGRPSPLPDLPIQYADYACWQRQTLTPARLDDALTYWRRQLAGDVPVLDLPSDRPRPAVQTFRGSMHPFVIDVALLQALHAVGRDSGVTLFQTLLAAFGVLLHRYSGQEDIPIGSVTAGRDAAETEPLLGYFLNTLVLRLSVPASARFRDLLQHARDVTLGALAHDRVPFSVLLSELRPRRDASRNPLFQSMMSLEPPMPRLDARWQLTQMDVDTGATKYDLYLEMDERRDGLLARFHYSTDLFEASTIARMAQHYETLLRSIVANPDSRVSDLAILPDAERHRLVLASKETARPVPDGNVQQWIEARATRTPHRVAVQSEQGRLTYARLNRRANQFAWILRDAGVGPESRVGILLDRSPEMVAAILGVLKAGGAYVPLDAAWPDERLAFVIEDAAPAAIITTASFAGRMRPPAGTTIVRADDLAGDGRRARSTPPDRSQPASLAYVLYTSGSTGQPKGVQVEHRNLANFLHGMVADLDLGAQTVFLAVTTLSFDIAALELLGPLVAGGRIDLVSARTARDPAALVRRIDRSRATVMQATATTWRMLVDAEWQGSDRLTILSGGEAIDPDLACALRCRGRRTWNLYGPTEATVWASRHEVSDVDRHHVPIGRPLANTQLYVADPSLNLVPIGVPGEILIGGAGVARGYLGRPALTRERFVADPFAADSEARVYRTGDVGRMRPDGRFEFLGRRDAQVKVRGHRIELGEIEMTLAGHPDVTGAAVVVREGTDRDASLVAYVVLRAGGRASSEALRSFLQGKLPDYMVPQRFIPIEAIPLTSNGKLDRRALPPPETARVPPADHTAARDETEARLIELWERVLDVHPIGIREDFFALGGHSLIAIRLVALIEQHFGRRLPLAALLEAPTVERLAGRLRDRTVTGWSSLVPLMSGGSRPPLFCVHGHFGEVLFYQPLARQLGLDQPFFALQSSGQCGSPRYRAVPRMAAHYLEEIRRVQPRGPYRLGGYCFGALVAFEMAHQLEAAGEQVSLLLLMTGFEEEPVGILARVRRHVDHLRLIGVKGKLVLAGRSAESRVRARVISLFDRYFRERVGPDSWLALRIPEMNLLAAREYVPAFYGGRATILMSGRAPAGYAFDPQTGLLGMRAREMEWYAVAGERDTMMQEPFVDSLAAELRRLLARTDAQATGTASGATNAR